MQDIQYISSSFVGFAYSCNSPEGTGAAVDFSSTKDDFGGAARPYTQMGSSPIGLYPKMLKSKPHNESETRVPLDSL